MDMYTCLYLNYLYSVSVHPSAVYSWCTQAGGSIKYNGNLAVYT